MRSAPPKPLHLCALQVCELATYHATCEMVAKSKRLSMNASVASARRHGCALPAPRGLSAAQLAAFAARTAQPTRRSAVAVL